jgi:hypothetical protein
MAAKMHKFPVMVLDFLQNVATGCRAAAKQPRRRRPVFPHVVLRGQNWRNAAIGTAQTAGERVL